MEKLRRVLISILVISMIFSCVGCDTSSEPDETSGRLPVVEGKYLVADNTSEYKLVIPEGAGSLVQVATSEFNQFFSEATDIILPVITDKEIESNGKYISIGETTLLKGTDITYDYDELGRDGYKIVTKGENLFLIGGAEYGSLYAVYGLLEYLVDYDFFAKDCYTVAKGVDQIPLYNFEVTDVPDIPLRMAADGVVTNDNSTMYRLKVRPYIENFIPINGMWAHNGMAWVKDSKDSNIKWYNSNKTQLCYTAHGDKKEYQKMLKASLKTLQTELMKESVMADAAKTTVTFTIEDNFDTCNCDACNAIVEEYGALSASIILYLNDLNEMVKDWFASEEGKPYARDLKILFFAYLGYEAAPVEYNEETGKYEARNGIHLDDGVYCQLCPVNMDYYRPITDEANKEYYTNMRGWTDIVDGNLYLWYYSTNFSHYLAPYDYFDTMLENYRFAVESNTYYMFDQRQHNETGVVTGWSHLKNYLNSKLAWDVEQDVAELTDKFFDGYFGPASDDMREVFDELRVLTNYNKENKELGGRRSLYLEVVMEEYWPKDILERWLEKFEEAEKKIEVLKEANPSLYEMYRNHINGEKLSVLYLFVECYSYNTSEEIIDAYKAEFKEISDYFGLVMGESESSSGTAELYSKWGID